MKKDILQLILKEIKNLYFILYWCLIIGIMKHFIGYDNTIIVVFALIINYTLYGGDK